MNRIYLDNASTTRLDERVRDKMLPYLDEHFGNASSIHAFGQQTKTALEDARESVAKLLGATPAEIFFTSGGTESDNLALKGAAMAWVLKEAARKGTYRIISSPLEHKAVLESMAWLESYFGIETVYVKHDTQGRIDLDHLESLLQQRTSGGQTLVSLMHANNELGNVNPVQEIATLAHRYGALVHTDAVQTVGKCPVNIKSLGVEMLSLAAHKFHGSKGIGVLAVRTGVELENLFHGGSHERNRRAGTENVAAAVGLAEALRLSIAEQPQTELHVKNLRGRFLEKLFTEIPNATLNGDTKKNLSHIVNVSFGEVVKRSIEGDMLLLGLDAEGLAVSSGSACTSGTAKPSHVLIALGLSEAKARASVRFSFSKLNTLEDIDAAIEKLGAVIERFQK